jgi:hypothetical protein
MGSQAVHDACVAAPRVVVVRLAPGRWGVAEQAGWEHDGSTGPVTLVYAVVVAPYHGLRAAAKSAEALNARPGVLANGARQE